MNVAVIGGGYAGMAAAVTLAEQGKPVTVLEASRTLGGRARRVEHEALALDNGLHILVGACSETLRLMRVVGADPEQLLLRLPLDWRIHDRFALKAAGLPAPLHLPEHSRPIRLTAKPRKELVDCRSPVMGHETPVAAGVPFTVGETSISFGTEGAKWVARVRVSFVPLAALWTLGIGLMVLGGAVAFAAPDELRVAEAD